MRGRPADRRPGPGQHAQWNGPGVRSAERRAASGDRRPAPGDAGGVSTRVTGQPAGGRKATCHTQQRCGPSRGRRGGPSVGGPHPSPCRPPIRLARTATMVASPRNDGGHLRTRDVTTAERTSRGRDDIKCRRDHRGTIHCHLAHPDTYNQREGEPLRLRETHSSGTTGGCSTLTTVCGTDGVCRSPRSKAASASNRHTRRTVS